MIPYHWFQGESVQKLTAALNAAGPDARLEVHELAGHMALTVIPPGETDEAAKVRPYFNDSHVCPPQC